jgi:hypothetical protein
MRHAVARQQTAKSQKQDEELNFRATDTTEHNISER